MFPQLFKRGHNLNSAYTVEAPNLLADRTVAYPGVFPRGPFRSTAQRTVLFDRFPRFFLKSANFFHDLNVTVLTLIFRLSANHTVPTH
jgi:hypothetical protein